MYKKKGCSASRFKPSTAVDQPSQPPTPVVEQAGPEIKRVISRVLTAMKSGEYEKALDFIKEAISCNPLSGHLCHVEGLVYRSLAENAGKDSDDKSRHMEDGVFSALLAWELLPNSIRCASLYAHFLYQLGPSHQQWGAVIQVCQYALRMENPNEYGLPELLGEDASLESRIADERRKILMGVQEQAERRKLEFAEKKENEAVNTDGALYIKNVGMTMERRKKQSKAMMRVCNACKQKMIDKCKKKMDGDDEKMVEAYKGFWSGSLSAEMKMCFRKVDIEELEKHLKSLKCQLGVTYLSEAIDFAKKAETLKFWVCYQCVKKFGDYASYKNHFQEEHCNQEVLQLASELELGNKSDMVVNCVWKPVDSAEATKIIVNHTKSESAFDDPKWVFCEDNERAEILVRIFGMLVFLMKHGCLAPSHLCWTVEFTKDQFESTIQLSQFRIQELDDLQIICCLDASQLTEVLEFLRDVARNCGLSEDGEMDSSMDYKVSGDHFTERIHFSKDYSLLLWQESKEELDDKFEAIHDRGSAIILPVECEDDVFSDSSDVISWLHVGSNCGEILESWTDRRYIQRRQALKYLQIFQEGFVHISKLCDGHNQLSLEFQAFRVVGSMLVEEVEKMEKCPEYQTEHFLQILTERQQEIQDLDDHRARTELRVILKVLDATVADRLDGDQSGTEEISVEDDWKETDNSMKIVLRRLKLQLLKDICLVDAMILRIVSTLGKFEEQLTSISVYDYRSVIVPMMKSFLQKCLKVQYENAKEKSKAAEEALLAEMALEEAEKKIDKDSDDVKQKKKKKNKKKNKNPEKAKESEANGDSKKIELHEKGAEQDTDNPTAKNEDSLDEQQQLTLSDEERMLNQYIERQMRFEDEASHNVNGPKTEVTDEDVDSRE